MKISTLELPEIDEALGKWKESMLLPPDVVGTVALADPILSKLNEHIASLIQISQRIENSRKVDNENIDLYEEYENMREKDFELLSRPEVSIMKMAFCLRYLTYLTAERLGPRDAYHLVDSSFDTIGGLEQPNVGIRGEYTASVLYAGRDHNVSGRLFIEDVPLTLERQVEAYMARFFSGFDIRSGKMSRGNIVTLGLRTIEDVSHHSPIHTGFGLTQVLPIVVSALVAPVDGLLLIENPEVHLHPRGQAEMGRFLAEVAAAGVQVILETHSDHILNGIRRAVKEGTIPSQDTALYFFRSRSTDEEDSTSQVQHIAIDSDGNLDDWPEDFFDQFDKDMNYFAGWC